MPLHLATPLRNARANQLESEAGTSPSLVFRTGSLPANAAAAATGTVVVSIPLPSDWLTAAVDGVVSMNGVWPSTNATGDGPIGYARIENGGTTYLQGDVTIDGGGGAFTVQNVSVLTGQAVEVTGFSLTEPNAGS